jgi:hypothetical protein
MIGGCPEKSSGCPEKVRFGSRARLAPTKKGFFAKDWFTNGGKLDKMCTSPDCALNTQAAAELKATNTS